MPHGGGGGMGGMIPRRTKSKSKSKVDKSGKNAGPRERSLSGLLRCLPIRFYRSVKAIWIVTSTGTGWP